MFPNQSRAPAATGAAWEVPLRDMESGVDPSSVEAIATRSPCHDRGLLSPG